MYRGSSIRGAGVLLGVVILAPPPGNADDTGALLARIKQVGARGTGNIEASQAWGELVHRGPAALIDILTALDDADATAANWLRSAGEAIVEKELADGHPLPADKLLAYVLETRHSGAGRRLAYEWLARVDPTVPGRLLPHMLDDPGRELRRDAVALALADAQKVLDQGDQAAARAAYHKVLASARDRDQVEGIAKQLKQLGEPVDLTAQFGFITRWVLAGPFDNTGGTGFNTIFSPEKAVDLTATDQGKNGSAIRWTEYVTAEPYGLVDLNKALGKNMGAVAYAFAVVDSSAERPVQIRIGSNNAVKIFLNGKELYFREEYHHGMRMDQHVGSGILNRGRNEILIKVCQNEQTDSWAQNWSFQLRVCDSLGGAVPVTVSAEKAAALPTTKKG